MSTTVPIVALLGGQQMRLMRQLWKGPLNARELTVALNAEPGETPIALSTVQTLLRQLATKGAVDHEARERTFIFRPLVGEEDTITQATRTFVVQLFGGSVQALVAHLLAHEPLSRKEVKKLKKLVTARHKELKRASASG